MLRSVVSAWAIFGILHPIVGSAQVYLLPTPAPEVIGRAAWQLEGEPVYFAGNFYYPTGPTEFFDGNLMVAVGLFRGVPLYADTSLQPYSIVYVPTADGLLRPYERRRAGDIAGTTGSRVPSFPVEPGPSREYATVATPYGGFEEPQVPPEGRPSCSCCFCGYPACALPPCAIAAPGQASEPQDRLVQSAPPPTANLGVWIDFNDVRWFSDGPAVVPSNERFVQIGDRRGFPVYQERGGSAETIYVPAVEGGLLAPFRRR